MSLMRFTSPIGTAAGGGGIGQGSGGKRPDLNAGPAAAQVASTSSIRGSLPAAGSVSEVTAPSTSTSASVAGLIAAGDQLAAVTAGKEPQPICNDTAAMPSGPKVWAQMTPSDHEAASKSIPCHWTNLTHWALRYRGVDEIKMCTHDPEVDTVISSHLHKWGA